MHQQMIDPFGDTPKEKKKPRRKSKSKSAVSDESDAYTASVLADSGEDSDTDMPNTTNALRELVGQSSVINMTPKRTMATSFVSPPPAKSVAGPSHTGAR